MQLWHRLCSRPAAGQTIVAVGCTDCGARCARTDETTPPLTQGFADAWWEIHQLVCEHR